MSLSDTSPFDTLTGQPLASQAFVDSIVGPGIAGWAVQILLFGVLAGQFVDYVTSPSFTRDSARLRWFLGVVGVLCLFQTGINFWQLYHYATCQQRSAEVLYGQTVPDAMAVLPVGVQGALVQGYLAFRTSGLFQIRWKKLLFLALIGGGIVTGLFGSVVYTILSVYDRAGRANDLLPLTFENSTGAWLWGCAIVDVAISMGLGIQLYQKLGGINENTNGILVRLIRGAVTTASYTAVLALLGAIFDFSFSVNSPANQAAIAFYSPLSACYALALVHTLSTRSEIRELHNSGDGSGSHQTNPVRITRGGVAMSVMRTTVTSGGEGEEENVHFPTPAGKFSRVEFSPRGQGVYGEKDNIKVVMPFGDIEGGDGRV